MTTPKVECEDCGYIGEFGVEIYDDICQECWDARKKRDDDMVEEYIDARERGII